MAEKNVINTLNKVMQGENMAINIYDTYLETIEDHSVKSTLYQFKNDHQRHSQILNQKIIEMGGQPQNGTGLAGFMANTMAKTKTALGMRQAEILKQLYDGEDQGIAKSREIMQGNLDEKSQLLVQEILAKDESHLGQLEQLIAKTSKDN